jgi:sugar phosphate isomerase/epimerase
MKSTKLNTILSFALVIALGFSNWSCNNSPKQEAKSEIAHAHDDNRFGGLQLYTLRNDIGQNGENLESVLKAVADAGYKNIEAAGYNQGKYYGLTPADFKSLLEKYHLNPISSHQGSITFENADQELADAIAVGFKYFVIPVPPMGMFTFNRETQTIGMEGGAKHLTEVINQLGEKAHAAGISLLYHNHHFEFTKDEEGIKVFDYLVENSNPDHVNFEMDLYWVEVAKESHVDYFKKYPGRFKLWHVKDMDDQGRFAPVGEGHIDFKTITENAATSGMEYYFVEQDQTFNHTPFEAIKISHEGLKKFGLDKK